MMKQQKLMTNRPILITRLQTEPWAPRSMPFQETNRKDSDKWNNSTNFIKKPFVIDRNMQLNSLIHQHSSNNTHKRKNSNESSKTSMKITFHSCNRSTGPVRNIVEIRKVLLIKPTQHTLHRRQHRLLIRKLLIKVGNIHGMRNPRLPWRSNLHL